jgi:hypothetical protein
MWPTCLSAYFAYGESLAPNATGFLAIILQMTPIWREYLRFFGHPARRSVPVLPLWMGY